MGLISGLGNLFSGIGNIFSEGNSLPQNTSVNTPMYQGSINGKTSWNSDLTSFDPGSVRNVAMDLNNNGKVDIGGMDYNGIQDLNSIKIQNNNSGLGGSSILGKAWDGIGGLNGAANLFAGYQSYKNMKFNQKLAKRQQDLVEKQYNDAVAAKKKQEGINKRVAQQFATKKYEDPSNSATTTV